MGHLQDAKEGYLIHMGVALRFALYLFAIAFVCIVHAVLPSVFVNTASNMVLHLNQNMQERKGETNA